MQILTKGIHSALWDSSWNQNKPQNEMDHPQLELSVLTVWVSQGPFFCFQAPLTTFFYPDCNTFLLISVPASLVLHLALYLHPLLNSHILKMMSEIFNMVCKVLCELPTFPSLFYHSLLFSWWFSHCKFSLVPSLFVSLLSLHHCTRFSHCLDYS